MRRLLIALALLAIPATSDACWRCRRQCQPARPAVTYQWTYATPQAVSATPQAVTYQATVTDEAGAFLASLNAWRAAYGRHPLSWDYSLAAYAASNAGVHAPGTSGGASQAWAGTTSLMSALQMWQSSPAHAAILLNATTSVGASMCPSGVTCNSR